MSITEQVKELRALASIPDIDAGGLYDLNKKLYQAADTIEALSAKLQAANMERSADCGGWIPCKDRLPTKSGIYEISFKTREGSGHDFAEWRNGFFCIPADVIAWREHLEPYKPKQKD